MERSISMQLGVVIERRELDNPWQRHGWRSVAVVPGAPPVDQWRELVRGERFVRWHAATLPLELHRSDTEAYRVNLSGRSPAIYVVLRNIEPTDRTAGNEVAPFAVTASPYDAEGYMEGDDLIDAVPMSEGLVAWVHAFVERHHVEQPFEKRKRKRFQAEDDHPANHAEGVRGRQRGHHG